MSCLERAIRRTRKPTPTVEELEMALSEERSNETVKELFQGWCERGKLPPEMVLKTLLEEGMKQ